MQNKIEKITFRSADAERSRGFVLVVDDEEHNRSLLRDSLEARGYSVSEAENGMCALQKVAQHQPDVILLDLMMPELDGFEVCRRLKMDPKTAHLPILLVTALSEREDRLLGIQAGANDFLNKPIDLQDVILRVRNAVYAKRLHDDLRAEQEKSDLLLLSILPRAIAERMKQGETNIADSFADATVLVADLVGFTSLSAQINPVEIVHLLNEIFSAFDLLVERHDLEKIKTIGDAYMVAGGINLARTDHAEAITGLAIDLQEEIAGLNKQYNTSIRLRIGISTGPVVAGVIGRGKFAYDLWGETVNLACFLEASAGTGQIQVSAATYERVKNKFEFGCSHNVDAKGQGQSRAYLLGIRLPDEPEDKVDSAGTLLVPSI
jgi:adenylate cyclase